MTEQTRSRGPRTEEAFERLDEEARGVGDQTARRAAVAAVVAAGAGALAGAVKAMLESRREEHREDGREPAAEVEREPEAKDSGRETDDVAEGARVDAGQQEAEDRDEPGQEEPESAPEDEADPEDEPEPEDEAEREQEPERKDESEPQPEQEPSSSGLEHLAATAEPDDEKDDRDESADLRDADEARSDAVDIVLKARDQLERLLGREAESVSGIERTDGHWSVSLEVVEMRRVPESTDVLASYEVVLDDEGHVARLRQTRRYRRSQVEADR